MERSPELEAVAQRYYDALGSGDEKALGRLIADGPDTVILGTDPDEWLVGSDKVIGVILAQAVELGGYEATPTRMVAYRMGDTGFAFDQPLVRVSDVDPFHMRVSFVFRLMHGQWEIVHVHHSVAASNVEVLGRDLTTSVDQLADAASAERPSVAAATSPDGTVTLVFSDIEGSTDLLGTIGDRAYMELLRWHNSVIRQALGAWDGFEVDRAGDGFFLAFSSARAALHYALDVQDLVAAGSPDGLPDIKVRMGAHTGEVLRDSDEFYGHAVHFAARVASAANGGEVYASAIVKELATGGDGLAFREAITTRLKGFDGEHRLYAVARG